MEKNEIDSGDPKAARSLVVVFSYHHGNTKKIAEAVAHVLGAEVRTPHQVTPEEIAGYDLVGFGSGIYSAQHHESLLDLADALPQATGRRVFIFSTYGAPAVAAGGDFVRNNHSQLRERLQAKGYTVSGEFGALVMEMLVAPRWCFWFFCALHLHTDVRPIYMFDGCESDLRNGCGGRDSNP